MKKIITLLVALASLCTPLSAQQVLRLNASTFDVPQDQLEKFNAYDLVELDVDAFYQLWQQPGHELDFSLEVPGTENLSFDLVRYDQRAPNFLLETSDRSLSFERLPAAQYKGRLEAEQGAKAIFTIDEQFVLGYWQQSGEEYFLEPLWLLWEEAPRNVYLIYRTSDLDPYVGECGFTDANPPTDDDREFNPPAQDMEMMPCLDVEIALAADFLLFQDFSNNANSVQNFMLNTLALVQTNYDSEAGDDEFANELNYFVTDILIATTSPDPWTTDTDPGELLSDFRDWGNDVNFSNSYDVASLWSGRNFDGPTVGVAYRPGVCTDSRYNILERFNISSAAMRSLWAHELGHNWNIQHDPGGSNFIMAPSITLTDNWSTQSRNSLNDWVANSATCLSTCPTTVPNVVAFTPYSNVCSGSMIPFFNESVADAATFEWQFPGANPTTSNLQHPIVTYNNPGNFTATLSITNSFGTANGQNNITVASENSTKVVFFENFEAGFGDITVINPDNNFTWGVASIVGNRGEVVAFLNNYDNDGVGQSDFLQLPDADLSGLAGTTLEIEYAYSPFPGSSDVFKVNVTTSAGTQTVFTSDASFPTKPATDNSRFVPEGPEDWCASSNQCLSIDLSAFDGESSVSISLENENNYGNILFVDNIALVASCPSVAPVEWLGFLAQPLRSAAQLDWSVNQDEVHAGFLVERADPNNNSGGISWKEIGYVEARGGAANNVRYRFLDTDVRPGDTYLYRLRQQDRDGIESLSTIQRVSFNKAKEIMVFPNPTNGTTEIRMAGNNGQYQLIDPLGKVIISGVVNDGQARVDLSNLPAAVYWLRVQGDDQQSEIIRLAKR